MALAVKDIANKLLHRAWMDEDIVAWQYGPVVPEVYNQFSAAGLVTQTHSESPWIDKFIAKTN